MSAVLEIEGRRYIQLAAVPYITNKFIDVPKMLDIIGQGPDETATHDPDDYIDPSSVGPELDLNLYQLNENGKCVAIPLGSVWKLMQEFRGEPGKWAVTRAADVLLDCDAVEYG